MSSTSFSLTFPSIHDSIYGTVSGKSDFSVLSTLKLEVGATIVSALDPNSRPVSDPKLSSTLWDAADAAPSTNYA